MLSGFLIGKHDSGWKVSRELQYSSGTSDPQSVTYDFHRLLCPLTPHEQANVVSWECSNYN